LAEQRGIASRLHWPASVPVAELGAYVQIADVCVQLRDGADEGPSASLYRALTSGAACVFSDQGDTAGIPPSAALKARAGEHEAADLAAALRRRYEPPDERTALAQSACRYVQENYSAEAVAGRYAALLEMAAAARASTEDTWAELTAEAVATCC